MTGFVSSRPCTEPDSGDLVYGGDFYPPLSLAGFRDSMRIPSAVTDARVRDAMRGAMLNVKRDLAAWSAAKIAAGVATLEDASCDRIDFEGELVTLYRRAVFCYAAADLAETHSDVSATKHGEKSIDDRCAPADEMKREALLAVRDILGVGRTSVELI